MGIIYDLGKIFKDLNMKIASISIYPNTEVTGNKIIVLRIEAMNPLIAIEKLEASGFNVISPGGMH